MTASRESTSKKTEELKHSTEPELAPQPQLTPAQRVADAASTQTNGGGRLTNPPVERHRSLLTGRQRGSPASRPVRHALAERLQQQYGNRYMQRLLQAPGNAGLQIGATASPTLQRHPDDKSPTEETDPIDEESFPGYGWHRAGSTFYGTKPGALLVRGIIAENAGIDRDLLAETTASFVYRKYVKGGTIRPSYTAFRHPAKGIVARAFAERVGFHPEREPDPKLWLKQPFDYDVYVFSPRSGKNAGQPYTFPAPLSSAPPLSEEEREQKPGEKEDKTDVGEIIADLGTDFAPGVSNVKDAIIAATGVNPVTGEKVGIVGRIISGIFAIPGLGNLLKYVVKGGKGIGKGLKWLGKLVRSKVAGKIAALEVTIRLSGKRVTREMIKEFGKEGFEKLAKELGPKLTAELAEKLGPRTLKQVVDNLGTQGVKQLAETLGSATLKNVVEKLGVNAVKELTDRLGAKGLKELVDTLGVDAVQALTREMGAKAVGDLTADMTAAGLKGLVDKFGAEAVGKLLKELGQNVVEKLTKELGASVTERLFKSMDATTFHGLTLKDTIAKVGVDDFVKLVTQDGADAMIKYGGEALQKVGKADLDKAAALTATTMSASNLQKKWKHAADFGVTTSWKATDKAAHAQFKNAVDEVVAKADEVYLGPYHNSPWAVHAFKGNQIVVTDLSGNFISGWTNAANKLAGVKLTAPPSGASNFRVR
jgi:hypothetical protein